MKFDLFISYSDFDKTKVNVIEKELEGHTSFLPLVIASKREAQKPLAKKVSEGIIKSVVVIPILTEKSIATQWINQEIGFATALEKKIRPIVESSIIDKLKGFIHKQIDLPYTYDADNDPVIENTNFLSAFRKLIFDLEKEFIDVSGEASVPVKTAFEESLEQVGQLKSHNEFQNQREIFLRSPDSVNSARQFVLNMFNDIKTKLQILRSNGFQMGMQEEEYEPKFIFSGKRCSCSIAWLQPHYDSIQDAVLSVRFYKGYVSIKKDAVFFPSDQPVEFAFYEYKLDIDKNSNLIWHLTEDKKNYTSEQVADKCIKTIVDKVVQGNLTEG